MSSLDLVGQFQGVDSATTYTSKTADDPTVSEDISLSAISTIGAETTGRTPIDGTIKGIFETPNSTVDNISQIHEAKTDKLDTQFTTALLKTQKDFLHIAENISR